MFISRARERLEILLAKLETDKANKSRCLPVRWTQFMNRLGLVCSSHCGSTTQQRFTCGQRRQAWWTARWTGCAANPDRCVAAPCAWWRSPCDSSAAPPGTPWVGRRWRWASASWASSGRSPAARRAWSSRVWLGEPWKHTDTFSFNSFPRSSCRCYNVLVEGAVTMDNCSTSSWGTLRHFGKRLDRV